jgi:hypothetical protein
VGAVATTGIKPRGGSAVRHLGRDGRVSLAAASGVMGGVAVVSAVLLLRYAPRYLPKRAGQATSP